MAGWSNGIWCGTDALNERRSQRSAATGGVVTEVDAIRLAERMQMDGDVHTVLRRHHVTSHVRDDTTESQRTARKSGVRRVTTRTVRQTTTITRGEQRSMTENVNRLDDSCDGGVYGRPNYFQTSERDASLYEERVPVPAITYHRLAPVEHHSTSFKRSKVVNPWMTSTHKNRKQKKKENDARITGGRSFGSIQTKFTTRRRRLSSSPLRRRCRRSSSFPISLSKSFIPDIILLLLFYFFRRRYFSFGGAPFSRDLWRDSLTSPPPTEHFFLLLNF